MRTLIPLLGLSLAALLPAGPARGAVLRAGAGQDYPTLALAVRAAQDGDTIHLGAGSYYECAVVTQRNLVIEGEGPATVVTDTTCEGKALLVVRGDGLTVRNLVLARARVPDRNGAGIRLEGQGLTLDRVHFENDEVGLLAAASGPGTVLVRDCTFTDGGVVGERPTAALMVGAVGLLRVERSTFERLRGTQVSTGAGRTELVDNTFGSGAEPGAGTVVSASAALSMQGNVIRLGPNAPPRGAAVVATGPAVTLERTRLENGTGHPAILLLDWTGGTPVLSGNVVQPGDSERSTSGSLRHQAGGMARSVAGGLRQVAGEAKRGVLGLVGR